MLFSHTYHGGDFMRKKKSLSRQMRDEANKFFDENIQHSLSNRQYRRDFKKFIQFCRERGVKSLDEGKELVQEYSDYLIATGRYSASSCHTFLAPVCKLFKISMSTVKGKKIRRVAEYTKGRKPKIDKYRAYSDPDNPRFAESVSIQEKCGIRRSELKRLKGEDFYENEFGSFIRVVKGKGGKTSSYYIHPDDAPYVKEFFSRKAPGELVFGENEFKNTINYHKMRAERAEKMYYYFLERVKQDENFKNQLKAMVIKNWEDAYFEKTGKHKKYDTRQLEGLYHLRGANREKAKRLGNPVTYSRLCLAASSCLCLAHHRLNISILYISLYE